MIVLGIDTSSSTASVAICMDDKILAESTFITKLTHSQIILPLVERVISDANLTINDIDAYAVANGPGSYTGLRIGISAVKAIAFAQGKKCAGISTLQSLAYNCIAVKGTIVSLIKARENISYYAIFKSDGNNLTRISDDNIADIKDIINEISELSDDVILIGDYAEDIFTNYSSNLPNVRLAPQSINISLATSICYLAKSNGFDTPNALNASYLQITKAEKDKSKNN